MTSETSSRHGIAVPLVLLFVLIFGVFLASMLFTRTTVRHQTLATHTQKKAYYMAMGAVQHALLKLRLLHREAYDAGCVSRGVCPFFNPYGENLVAESSNNRSEQALHIFTKDLNTGAVPLALKGDPYPIPDDAGHPWRYEIASFAVATYYTSEVDGSVKEVAHIQALGYAYDPRDQVPERTEFVQKTVELQRRIK